jgi:hypothetical protein
MFAGIMPRAITLFSHNRHELDQMSRIIGVWETRAVFGAEVIAELKATFA